MQRNLLIVGVDPGTTAAFAALDLDGNVVATASGKGLGLASIIRSLTRLGQPLIIGTDKRKTPSMIRSLAAKTGARVFHPHADILISEKRQLTAGQHAGNDHERDALAAATLAHQTFAGIIRRVGQHCRQEHVEQHEAAIMRRVILDEKNIAVSIDEMREKPAAPVARQRPVAKPAVRKQATPKKPVPAEGLAMRNAHLERELALLRQHNQKLNQKLTETIRAHRRSRTRLKKELEHEKAPAKRDAPVKRLSRLLQRAATEKRILEQRVSALRRIILGSEELVPVKKVHSLGLQAFRRLQAGAGIREGDILFVEHPEQYSDRVVAELKKKVRAVIVERQAPAAVRRAFSVIERPSVKAVHDLGEFWLVDKQSLEKALAKRDVLSKVLAEYRSERSL